MITRDSRTVHISKAIIDALLTELPHILRAVLKESPFQLVDGITPKSSIATLLTRKQVANRLGQSVQTVARLLVTGALPYARIGRSVLIRESDLQAFIESRSASKAVGP